MIRKIVLLLTCCIGLLLSSCTDEYIFAENCTVHSIEKSNGYSKYRVVVSSFPTTGSTTQTFTTIYTNNEDLKVGDKVTLVKVSKN